MAKLRDVLLLPSRDEWRGWDLHKKVSYVGFWVMVLTLFTAVGTMVLGIRNGSGNPDSPPPTHDPNRPPPLGPNEIRIDDVALLESRAGEQTYSDRALHSFRLTGRHSIQQRDKYSIAVAYRILSHADQRYGWYLVTRLDVRGFAIPHTVDLDEFPDTTWEYHTSRIYLQADLEPRLSFVAFAIPKLQLAQASREIVNDSLGWGRTSLEFLRRIPGAVASNAVSSRP